MNFTLAHACENTKIWARTSRPMQGSHQRPCADLRHHHSSCAQGVKKVYRHVKMSHFDGVMNGGRPQRQKVKWLSRFTHSAGGYHYVCLSTSSRACVMFMCVCAGFWVYNTCITAWGCACRYASKSGCDISELAHSWLLGILCFATVPCWKIRRRHKNASPFLCVNRVMQLFCCRWRMCRGWESHGRLRQHRASSARPLLLNHFSVWDKEWDESCVGQGGHNKALPHIEIEQQ